MKVKLTVFPKKEYRKVVIMNKTMKSDMANHVWRKKGYSSTPVESSKNSRQKITLESRMLVYEDILSKPSKEINTICDIPRHCQRNENNLPL